MHMYYLNVLQIKNVHAQPYTLINDGSIFTICGAYMYIYFICLHDEDILFATQKKKNKDSKYKNQISSKDNIESLNLWFNSFLRND